MLHGGPALRRANTPACSAWRTGAGRRSTRPCGSSRKTRGTGCTKLRRAGAEHPVPDAAAKRKCRRLHELPGQRRVRVREGSRRRTGMDIFRIFDANNWLPNLSLAIDAVRKTDAICEAADLLHRRHPGHRSGISTRSSISWTWRRNSSNAARTSWRSRTWPGCSSRYAGEETGEGACGPEIDVPIHFHTHDTAGGQLASYLMAAEEGVDIVDCAFAPLSGITAQPNLERAGGKRCGSPSGTPKLDFDAVAGDGPLLGGGADVLQPRSRPANSPSSAEVYLHEMPGGQYANLYRASEVARPRRPLGRSRPHVRFEVNQLFGDIVKVTPTSEGRRRHDPVPASPTT